MEDNENPLKNWHPQEVIAHTQEQLELSGINTKMGSICKRKGTAFSAGILFFCALSLVCIAVGSNYWAMADLERSVQAGSNTTKVIKGGSKNFGLFNGKSQENFGLGTADRTRTFKVKEEFKGIANDNVVRATVGFCILSLPFIITALSLSCVNEFAKTDFVLFGVTGIYICSGIASTLLLVAACLYAALFEMQLKKNVVRPTDKDNGFSSADKARLGYCYWILLGSVGVIALSCVIILLHSIHITHYFKTTKPKERTADGVMLY